MQSVVLARAASHMQGDVDESVLKALDSLKYDLNRKIDTVLIKPNLCYYWDYSTGETTDPRVVSAIVEWVRQRIGNDVSVCIGEADATAMKTKYVFRMLGYEKLGLQKNAKLTNLSEGEIVQRKTLVNGKEIVLPVNKMLTTADMIINVPKIKYNRTVGFTCALKNMFGAIAKPHKYSYHSRLAEVIVGINKIVKTDIVVVDGLIAAGKVPRKLGVIITGNGALSTDLIVAQAIGFKASRIPYLKLAVKEKLGEARNINLVADSVTLAEINREYPAQNHLLQKILWSLELKVLRTYARLAGDVIPPVLEE